MADTELQDSVATHCPAVGRISAVMEDWRWVLLVSRVSCPWVYSLIPCWKHRQKLWPKHPYSSPVFCLRITALLSQCMHVALGYLAITTPTAATFRRSLAGILTCFSWHYPTISWDGIPILSTASSRGSKGCWCSWPPVSVYCPTTLFSLLLFIILIFLSHFSVQCHTLLLVSALWQAFSCTWYLHVFTPLTVSEL